jgi:hypothetical protein
MSYTTYYVHSLHYHDCFSTKLVALRGNEAGNRPSQSNILKGGIRPFPLLSDIVALNAFNFFLDIPNWTKPLERGSRCEIR